MAQAAPRVESVEPKSTVGGSESRAVAVDNSTPVPLKHDWVFWHDKYVLFFLFTLLCSLLGLLWIGWIVSKKNTPPCS